MADEAVERVSLREEDMSVSSRGRFNIYSWNVEFPSSRTSQFTTSLLGRTTVSGGVGLSDLTDVFLTRNEPAPVPGHDAWSVGVWNRSFSKVKGTVYAVALLWGDETDSGPGVERGSAFSAPAAPAPFVQGAEEVPDWDKSAMDDELASFRHTLEIADARTEVIGAVTFHQWTVLHKGGGKRWYTTPALPDPVISGGFSSSDPDGFFEESYPHSRNVWAVSYFSSAYADIDIFAITMTGAQVATYKYYVPVVGGQAVLAATPELPGDIVSGGMSVSPSANVRTTSTYPASYGQWAVAGYNMSTGTTMAVYGTTIV